MALVGAIVLNVVVCYRLARPVPGVGILMPGLFPPLVAALSALWLAPEQATPATFIASTFGPLVGADLLHLRQMHNDPPMGRRTITLFLCGDVMTVVHGHSSHHVQGIEVYRDRAILYGCGDFLNDYEGIGGYRAFRGELGLMYFPQLDAETGRLVRFAMTPTRIHHLRVERAPDEGARWLLGS